jgi:hypothetical protein
LRLRARIFAKIGLERTSVPPGLSMSSASVAADSPYFGTLSLAAAAAAGVSTSVITQASMRANDLCIIIYKII